MKFDIYHNNRKELLLQLDIWDTEETATDSDPVLDNPDKNSITPSAINQRTSLIDTPEMNSTNKITTLINRRIKVLINRNKITILSSLKLMLLKHKMSHSNRDIISKMMYNKTIYKTNFRLLRLNLINIFSAPRLEIIEESPLL